MNKIILVALVAMLGATATYAEDAAEQRPFQLSLVSPLGTNGTRSGQVANKVSINIIGGHSYASEGFEFGSIYNVNLHHTSGFQFAGVANHTRESRNAVQLAGIGNIAKSGTSPFQLAGILNIANEVSGLQMAGLVNVAKQVRGVQFGLVNYADECSGVPIGLINIVRHGGKQEFEVGLSEALNTYASFKLGVDKFYTIFSAGVDFLDTKPVYGVGLGFGTDIHWKQEGWANQIEAVGYSLTEDGKFQSGVNMLAQLKFTFSKQLYPHFKVFAGPTLNLTISDHENPETGKVGCTLKPYSMFHSDGSTALNGWVGLGAGVRF